MAAFGLGLGNHLTIVGLLPAAVAYVLLRDRRVVTGRFMAAAVVVMLVCLSQYGFIVLRTYQGAPYLESSATSLRELVGVVTAERFANQRFAFSLSTLLTVQVPEVAAVIRRELGTAGVLLVGAGLFAAARRRSLAAGLVFAAAVGMLVMVVNLRGDTNGFITPAMALLWPLAGYGIDATAQWLQSFRVVLGVEAIGRAVPSLRSIRLNLGHGLLAAAMAMPIASLYANYAAADQSGNTDQARVLRSMFAQLPDRAAVVAEDYFLDSALQYLIFTGEAGAKRNISRLGFTAEEVRAAARDGRRVFALSTGATFLGTEGLRFERTTFDGRGLDEWLSSLPVGTIVVGATAHTPVPRELLDARQRPTAAARPPRPFNAFALVVGRPEIESREDGATVLLAVDSALLKRRLPGLAGRLEASADADGARMELAGRTVAEIDFGLALSVFAPDGALLTALTLPAGQPLTLPLESSVYELRGEAPCVGVSTDAWSDVSPVLGTGGVLTSLSGLGSVAIETELAGPGGDGVRAAELLGAGDIRMVDQRRSPDGSDAMVAELVRTRNRRPAFRLAFDSSSRSGRAKLRPGGVQSSVSMCAQVPAALLTNRDAGAVTPHFDQEAYFGAGWSGPERSGTGTVRRGASGATLLLPLDAGDSYRLRLDVVGLLATPIEIRLNGQSLHSCAPRERVPCEVTLPADLVKAGVNAVTLSFGPPADADPMPLTFRGLQVRRLNPEP